MRRRLARKYNKKFEVYQTTTVLNDYGGGSDVETKLADVWCEIKTLSRYKLEEGTGVSDIYKYFELKTRKRTDFTFNPLNMYMLHAGVRYEIVNDPVDVDFNGSEIKIILTRGAD